MQGEILQIFYLAGVKIDLVPRRDLESVVRVCCVQTDISVLKNLASADIITLDPELVKPFRCKVMHS